MGSFYSCECSAQVRHCAKPRNCGLEGKHFRGNAQEGTGIAFPVIQVIRQLTEASFKNGHHGMPSDVHLTNLRPPFFSVGESFKSLKAYCVHIAEKSNLISALSRASELGLHKLIHDSSPFHQLVSDVELAVAIANSYALPSDIHI